MTVVDTAAWLTGGVLNFSACGCFLASQVRRAEEPWGPMNALWAAGFSLWCATALMAGSPGLAVFYGVLAALSALAWWHDRRRRGRKRALRSLGAKSAALIAELCRKARESARPRQMLRPVPGGAR